MSYTTEGRIIAIEEPQSFASGFTKREFVIEADEKYPQQVKFECVKDGVAMLDGRKIGDHVTVHFNLRGREYNGRYFVNLNCWKIEGEKGGNAGDNAPPDTDAKAEVDEEECPF